MSGDRPTCETCEGEGLVAVNFGIDSPGRPDIRPCPDCTPMSYEALVARRERQ